MMTEAYKLKDPNVYEVFNSLIQGISINSLKDLVSKSLTETSQIFEIIDRDIHRCYPDHVMFAKSNGDGY